MCSINRLPSGRTAHDNCPCTISTHTGHLQCNTLTAAVSHYNLFPLAPYLCATNIFIALIRPVWVVPMPPTRVGCRCRPPPFHSSKMNEPIADTQTRHIGSPIEPAFSPRAVCVRAFFCLGRLACVHIYNKLPNPLAIKSGRRRQSEKKRTRKESARHTSVAHANRKPWQNICFLHSLYCTCMHVSVRW